MGCGSCGESGTAPGGDAGLGDGEAGPHAEGEPAFAPPEPGALVEPARPPPSWPPCPEEMVFVAHRFCIDRFEAMLVDLERGRTLSPYYPPVPEVALLIRRTWDKERLEIGGPEAREMALPSLPVWQTEPGLRARAVSRPGVVPSGYLSGIEARRACAASGKRLCTLEEWRTACRGERDEPFPYGPVYEAGRCNVFREAHPAAVLHGDASQGHLDPRLNLVRSEGRPLLRRTGETADCRSRWGEDGAVDMVGNLDEWIDDQEGTFVGAFYARSKKDGCQSTVTNHPIGYFDYSTGVRCCAEAR